MTRRGFSRQVAVLPLIGTGGLWGCDSPKTAFGPYWSDFKSRFMSRDGRIRDRDNGDISHSEGQGFGLLFAEAADDPESFRKILAWTMKHLRIRDDSLFAWKYDPSSVVKVPDRNNASDGDMLIAWALLRGAQRWRKGFYNGLAMHILKDVRNLCVQSFAGRAYVLLPGTEGFTVGENIVLNASYSIFPAFLDFASITKDPTWAGLYDEGLQLLKDARFGTWDLPPDWVMLTATGDYVLPETFPPRFSWDAIRVPLYLYWAEGQEAEGLASFHRFINGNNGSVILPAWIDLETGLQAPFAMSFGAQKVMALTQADTAKGPVPSLPRGEGYYSSALYLLSLLAREAQLGALSTV